MSAEKRNIPRSPAAVDLEITSRCNLRCLYCSHFNSAGDVANDLPARDWLEFLRELGVDAVMNLTLSGGEPFIREDLKELISGIVRNRMRFGVLSNGTLITAATAAFLAETGRCNYVQVSIDGPGPEVHDLFRGDGCFHQALRGLRHLIQAKVSATVRVTIHRHNVDHLEEVARLLLEEIGLGSFSTNSAAHMGLCRQNEDMVQLNPEEYARAMTILLKLNRKYQNRISAQSGPLASARIWLEMLRARRAGRTLPGAGYLTGCGGVMNKISVRADGVMVPCSQLSHLELGRINQDRLTEVWLNHPELQRLRERTQTPLRDLPFCSGCEYAPYCRGGCPAIAYNYTGQDCQAAPDNCLRRFLAAGGKLPDQEADNASA
jgi:SynChlorMet cassette radical SAM/SPASM protein ScmE